MSQKSAILAALREGQRLTPLNALIRFHTLALSQRIGEIKRQGWPVQSRMIELEGGKRVAEYWLDPHKEPIKVPNVCPLPAFDCACKGNYCRLLGRELGKPLDKQESAGL